ncbi:hypothetical protein ACSVDE_14835 [Pseudalkalibacillus sp. Hm43]|uniref:hypothetical protein n=1 Tax=Pseudalkalibacillus sp. Hm43 TaxID=3450742 RepID=UPI003F433842
MKRIFALLLSSIMIIGACEQKEANTIESEDLTKSKNVKSEKINQIEQKQITPDEVMALYLEALENPNSNKVTEKFREKMGPLIEKSKNTLGENGPPNELQPKVRLKTFEEGRSRFKVETLEFANEAYKTGRLIRLTALYNSKEAQWYLDDIEIEEAANEPFELTWEEVEKYTKLNGVEIKKADEQIDPRYFEFSVINNNQMYIKGSVLKIDRSNGLVSFVSVPEQENTGSHAENDSVEDNTESTSKPVKTNYSSLKDYSGQWKDSNGIFFLKVENVRGISADISLDICSSKCVRLASIGPVTLNFDKNSVSHSYDEDGWGNSGNFKITLNPDGIVLTYADQEISMSQ